MNRRIKIWPFFVLLLLTQNIYSQTITDTAELVNEFKNVMSFAVQPSLYFSTITKLNATPVLQQHDTMSYKGVFYKNQANIYYNNGQEEMYIQDSLVIQVNQHRKSIWVSKLDIAAKENLNVLPVINKQVQELFRKKYTITKTSSNKETSRLNFVTNQKPDSSTVITTSIWLDYNVKDNLPILMEIEMRMQQPLSDELLTELKSENLADTKLIQMIGDKKYLVREQTISVAFREINNTKEKAMEMPSWKNILDYTATSNEFIAKGLYKDYDVTKTF